MFLTTELTALIYEFCRTRGEPAPRLLLTSGSLMEDIEATNDKGGEDETGPKLPPAGTARTAWQALQQYLVGFDFFDITFQFVHILATFWFPFVCAILDYVVKPGNWFSVFWFQEKYRSMHPRLPVIVAESILNVDRHMELPLWLVNIFKASCSFLHYSPFLMWEDVAWVWFLIFWSTVQGGKDAGAAGMAGVGADPAALLRIYLDFDRLAEATALVLEFIRAWSSLVIANHLFQYWILWCVLGKTFIFEADWFQHAINDRDRGINSWVVAKALSALWKFWF